MADAGPPAAAKSEAILEHIAAKDFRDFVDGGQDAEQLVRAISTGGKVRLALAATANLPELKNDFGINPGRAFEDWLRSILRNDNWGALEANLRDLPTGGLHYHPPYGGEAVPLTPGHDLNPRLAIVAADITTQTKVEFPRMADLYYARPAEQHPASFVRASMAIPFFFEPQRASLQWTDEDQDAVRRRWRHKAGFHGELPEEVIFVDGGVMSNFPIDVFHEPDVIPMQPTIGVKLGIDRRHARTINGLADFLGSMFEGVRNLRDFEFVRNNPEYKDLVEYIDIEGFNWIDFGISDANKLKLFRRGAEAAANFLRRFSWPRYREKVKANLLQRIKPVLWELSNIKDLDRTLEAFGMHDDEEIKRKIRHLQQRPNPYTVLWVDDSLTYPLPQAILDRLHTRCETVRNSQDALRYLLKHNVNDDDESCRVDLIISDVTRREAGRDDHLRGIQFAAMLAQDPTLVEIPVLFYAHQPEQLRERYGKELPPNVVNTPGRNTVMHGDFIAEVVDAIYSRIAPTLPPADNEAPTA
jgi:NTE family protein